MTVEEQLKKHILSHYRSIRAFTQSVDIPYSTVDTMFKRGIGGTGINTVMKIFHALNLDIESIETGCLTSINNADDSDLEKQKLLNNYDVLNDVSRKHLVEYSEFLASKQSNLKSNEQKVRVIRIARSNDSKVTEIETDISDLINAPITDEDL